METGDLPLTDADLQLLRQAIGEALDQFNVFRRQEGASLEYIFVDKLNRIEDLLSSIDPYEKNASRICTTSLRSDLHSSHLYNMMRAD